MCTLVQTLVVRGGKVLLGRWKTGAFAGRISGLLGESAGGVSPEAACVEVGRALAGVELDPARLRRRAFFTFEELDTAGEAAVALGATYGEHQLVYEDDEIDEIDDPRGGGGGGGGRLAESVVETDSFAPAWYPLDALPFDEMPEDDVHWYERVLCDNELLTGSFRFDGTRLVDHTLTPIPETVGFGGALPCPSSDDGGLLLLENPRCSKSRAMRSKLEEEGVAFTARDYLLDPLTLSDLEALSARLRNGLLQRRGGGKEGDAAAAAAVAAMGAYAACQLHRGAQPACSSSSSRVQQGGLASLMSIARDPSSLQRPILVGTDVAAVGRPSPNDAWHVVTARGGNDTGGTTIPMNPSVVPPAGGAHTYTTKELDSFKKAAGGGTLKTGGMNVGGIKSVLHANGVAPLAQTSSLLRSQLRALIDDRDW